MHRGFRDRVRAGGATYTRAVHGNLEAQRTPGRCGATSQRNSRRQGARSCSSRTAPAGRQSLWRACPYGKTTAWASGCSRPCGPSYRAVRIEGFAYGDCVERYCRRYCGRDWFGAIGLFCTQWNQQPQARKWIFRSGVAAQVWQCFARPILAHDKGGLAYGCT